jgi:hypothetical protein
MSQTRTPADEDTSSRFWRAGAETGNELLHAHRFLPKRFTDKAGILHIQSQGLSTLTESLRTTPHSRDFTPLQGNRTLHTLTLTLLTVSIGLFPHT